MFGWLYGKITDFRNALYEKDVFKSFSLGAKTVSVGNITVGGTGKTPLVAFIAEILAANGEKVCILTRGYGRENPKKRVLVSDSETILATAKTGGDEPFELANKLLGKAIVIADADRVFAAQWAREKFGATAFVLDDAFQHRRARRDLDVVIIDATNPFGNGKVLLSGILREPLENLKRAGLIVISRANLIEDAENLKAEIRKYNSACPIFVSENVISNLTELKNFPARVIDNETWNSNFETKRALAFCALGNPGNFFEQLRREKFDLAKTLAFPDHHFYATKDIAQIEREAKASGAEILLTTAKDAVKLENYDFDTLCFVVETRLCFDDESGFRQIIENV
jgi:tetraacyldisaccharide 4'-kinase